MKVKKQKTEENTHTVTEYNTALHYQTFNLGSNPDQKKYFDMVIRAALNLTEPGQKDPYQYFFYGGFSQITIQIKEITIYLRNFTGYRGLVNKPPKVLI